MTAALLCRTGDGRPRALEPGVATYLWTGQGLRHAWDCARETLLRLRPDVVVLHGPPSSITGPHFAPLVARVRAALPEARLWIGVGGDGWASEWRAGSVGTSQVLAPLVACAKAAHAVGAELVAWDFEAAWKVDPARDKRTRPELVSLARTAVVQGGAAAPDAVHAVTTYDHPSLHGAFPWAAVLTDTPVSVYLPQVYADDGSPDRGELPARVRRASVSQRAAERAGLLPPDVTPDVPGDVDRVPLVQLHGQHTGDLVAMVAETPLIGGWALPLAGQGGRSDESGVRALELALRIRRESIPGPGAVATWQLAHGLAGDGVVGPKTLAALAR